MLDTIRAAFLLTLSPDDLVYAGHTRSDRLHVVRLLGSKHDLEIDDPDPSRRDPERRLWSGQALCRFKGRDYYFTPRIEHYGDPCPACLAAWRAAGSPPLRGATDAATDAAPAWPLPFGWREVAIADHPWDVPAGGDPEVVRDGTGASVGELRAERRRFRRGDRVVRLVEYLDKKAGVRFGALYHDAREPLEEQWYKKGNETHCTRAAWTLMALGGIE